MPGRTVWVDTNIDANVTAATQVLTSLMSGVSSVDTRIGQWTLLRTLVGFDIAYAVHDAGEGSQAVSIGIGVTTQEAFSAAAVPDPQILTDFPVRGWVWRARYRIFGFAADQPAIFTRRIDLDIRAQRKLDNGEAFIVHNLTFAEGAAATVLVLGMVRQLWLVR